MGKIAGIIIGVLALLSVVIWWQYYRVYSEGSRDGLLFKFSHKGDIFKTYEGEIQQPGLRSVVPGTINSNNLFFSVIDQKIADSLNKCLGKTVRVHYSQYKKSLPWRGENYNGKNGEPGQYIVDRIESVSEAQPVNNF
ncbi:MAG: hypothetical protein RL660_2429 [Bacteroidota bacterium]|jgi:hypothetical protein